MCRDTYALIEMTIEKYDDPVKAAKLIDELRKTLPPETDRWNVRYSIWAFIAISLATPIYIIIQMAIQSKAGQSITISAPDALLTLSSTALGALASYITPFTKQRQDPPANLGKPATLPAVADPVNPPVTRPANEKDVH